MRKKAVLEKPTKRKYTKRVKESAPKALESPNQELDNSEWERVEEVHSKNGKYNGLSSSAESKKKALRETIQDIDKRFGKGTLRRLGDTPTEAIEVISTGAIALDLALAVGGLPRGRIIELYGPQSAGKTTVSLHTIAEAQKQGGVAAFIDVEHALDPIYARSIGVDIDELLLTQPSSGEEALDIAEMLIRSNLVDIVVIDSVAALVPKAEIEGDMGDSHIGLQARLMSQACRKLTAAISRSKAIVIFINQLRQKVGVIYGSPEVTSGGTALPFYASVRLDVRKKEALKNGDVVIGNRTTVKVVKNKVGPPFRIAEMDIIYGKGISQGSMILQLGLDKNIITKRASWYTYGERQLAQGKDATRDLLDSDLKLQAELLSHIKKETQHND